MESEEGLVEERSFDAVSRRVAGDATGRRALLAIGATGLMAALLGPFAAQGKNKKGTRKKKKTRNAQKACPTAPDLCATQVQPCVAALTTNCGGDPSCQDSIACCGRLGSCDFGGFISCVIATGSN